MQLRDRLITELNAIASGDDLALWAKRSMAEKNKLTENDAKAVEDAFGAKLAMVSSSTEEMETRANPNPAAPTPNDPKVDRKTSEPNPPGPAENVSRQVSADAGGATAGP